MRDLFTVNRGFDYVPLQKKSQWYTIDYHSIPFSINDISTGLSGTLNDNLKYHSNPLNGTKNPKYHSTYHSKNHSNTIGHLPLGPFKYHSKTIQKPMVFELYLNDIFVRVHSGVMQCICTGLDHERISVVSFYVVFSVLSMFSACPSTVKNNVLCESING